MFNRRPFSYICAIATILIGSVTVWAWIFGHSINYLTAVDQVAVLPNTGFGLVICGIALLFLVEFPVTPERRGMGYFLSGFCILLGAATLYEYIAGFNLGIDNLISSGPITRFVSFPNRMASYTAFNFIVKGLSLILIDYETKKGHRPSQYLTLVTMISPIQALLGYAYGIQSFATLGPYSFFVQMSPVTAFCWLLISAGTLYARPDVGVMTVITSKTPAAKFVRHMLAPAIAIPILMGWFVATAENFQQQNLGLGASLLALTCICLFVIILWKNGMELLRLQVQRDRALQDLRVASEAAQQANRAKSTFLANMSHEIRSPVGVIMGFADLLTDPQCAPQVRSYYADVVKRNGRSLLTILNDILDLSKVEANKLKVEISTVDLTSFVRDLYLVFRTEAMTKGIQLKFDWFEPLPIKIQTDPHRLRQILTNLLNNAFKFTTRGYVCLRVHVISRDESNHSAVLAFEVEDTGSGIPPNMVDKLFQPFEQADSSATRKFGGTGLGLALSKRLADAISGELVLKSSRPAGGSTFLLTLNVQTIDDREAPGKSAYQNTMKRLRGRRILLAEDSPDNRYLIDRLLISEGAVVDNVENGVQAVQKALDEDYDFILMDIQMPMMDGLEASSRLREKGYRKPIIALTAHAMKEDKIRSLSHGLNDHITKPIDRENLIRVLQRWTANPNS